MAEALAEVDAIPGEEVEDGVRDEVGDGVGVEVGEGE